MAKRKDSVALFEVITATKRKEAAAATVAEREPGPTRTPKWWFKGRPRPAESQVATVASDPNDPTAGAVLPSAYNPVQLAPSAPAAEPPGEASAPAVVQRVLPVEYAAPQSVTVEIPAAAPAERPRRAWFGFGIKKLGLDRDQQEVTVRFRYTTAVIGVFAILVALALAYVTGRRNSPPVATTNSPSTEKIRHGDVLAHVLNIGPEHVMDVPVVTAEPEPGRDKQPVPAPPQPPGGAKPAVNDPAGADFHVGLPRIIGLNYVIIQSFPDRKDAEAAQEFLEAKGIPTTVERVPKGWSANPRLWSVIGTHGFARPKTMPEYKQYVGAIVKASELYAGKSKWKKFEPSPLKWVEVSGAVAGGASR